MIDWNQREGFLSQLLLKDDTSSIFESAEQSYNLVGEFRRICQRQKLNVNKEQQKVMVVERQQVTNREEVAETGDTIETLNALKCSRSRFSENGGS